MAYRSTWTETGRMEMGYRAWPHLRQQCDSGFCAGHCVVSAGAHAAVSQCFREAANHPRSGLRVSGAMDESLHGFARLRLLFATFNLVIVWLFYRKRIFLRL